MDVTFALGVFFFLINQIMEKYPEQTVTLKAFKQIRGTCWSQGRAGEVSTPATTVPGNSVCWESQSALHRIRLPMDGTRFQNLSPVFIPFYSVTENYDFSTG